MEWSLKLREHYSMTRRRWIVARQGAQLATGPRNLDVHGGGKLFTATLKRMGIDSRFVNGLRVTDRETRDVARDGFGRTTQQTPRRGHFSRGAAAVASALLFGLLAG